MKRNIFTVCLIAFSFISFGQFGFEYNTSLEVSVSGTPLNNAWSGGLNYAQFSDFDYDFDGDLDLFVFDRSTNNIRVFTQEGTGANKYYKFAYKAREHFPDGLIYRSALVDYDQDGRKDLFTYGIGGLKVYRNVGDITNGLQWELITPILQTEYPNLSTALLVSASDIPGIIDVDNDGDIDILTFSQSGQTVEYHQNQSMELYGVPDSLIFVLRNQCWGKFREDVNTNTVSLNDQGNPCVGGDINNPIKSMQKFEKHAGSTLLALDYDDSGVLDLILGDVSFTNLVLLINGGTLPNTDSPMITVDNAFPSNSTPADVQLFPAAFYLDVDFDGIKDLIVAPNARNVSENETSVHFYKNLGTNQQPNFVFIQKDFLQAEMIDHGTASIPVFTDINEDGLDDLIIANFFRYKPILQKESTLAYYQNTGTASSPKFTYVDNNYLDLTNQTYGIRNTPTFGDLDGDGDEDMLLEIENGSLVYYENTSSGSGAIYLTGIQNYTNNLGQIINEGTQSVPQLFDLDDDGLLDLIIAKRAGTLIYYRNIGTANAPSFERTNDNLGNVNVASGPLDAFGTAHFFRLNGTTHLFMGNAEGEFIYYNEIDGNIAIDSSFNRESDNYLDIQTQGYSSFAVNDLDNDGNLELFVGQDLGGLWRFEANPANTSSVFELNETEVSLYPNPVKDQLTISANGINLAQFSVIDIHGKEVMHQGVNSSKTTLDTTSLNQGIYFVQIQLENGQLVVKKLIKK